MTCAKVVVTARLLTLDGEEFIGTNACGNPQATCPRLPGEGYAKCVEICNQQAHAEVAAIRACRNAGCDPRHGSMQVDYTYICEGCMREMDELCIRYVQN